MFLCMDPYSEYGSITLPSPLSELVCAEILATVGPPPSQTILFLLLLQEQDILIIHFRERRKGLKTKNAVLWIRNDLFRIQAKVKSNPTMCHSLFNTTVQ